MSDAVMTCVELREFLAKAPLDSPVSEHIVRLWQYCGYEPEDFEMTERFVTSPLVENRCAALNELVREAWQNSYVVDLLCLWIEGLRCGGDAALTAEALLRVMARGGNVEAERALLLLGIDVDAEMRN